MRKEKPKKRGTINISMEIKSQLDGLKSPGQSYDGMIRQLVKFWKEKEWGEVKKSSK